MQAFDDGGVGEHEQVEVGVGLDRPRHPRRDDDEVAAADGVAALAAPDVQKRFGELGVEGRASTPEELKAFYASETKRWTQVVERAKIPKQ